MKNDALILGVILAGGKGSRMGGKNKAVLKLGGKRLVDIVFERLAPQVNCIIFNGSQVAGLDIQAVADRDPDLFGPLAGVLAAQAWGRQNLGQAFQVLTVAVDSPFFPGDLAARLCQAGGPALAASGGEVQTTFGLWPDSYEDELRRYSRKAENPSLRGFARGHTVSLVDFSGPDHFFNINTPGDLEKAGKMIDKMT